MKRILYAALLATAFIPSMALAEGSARSQTEAQIINSSSLSRSDVLEIQQSLNTRGFLKGNADGVWSESTADALRRFQNKNKLEGDGELNANTLNELGVQLSMGADAGANTTTSGRSMSSINGGRLKTRIGTDQSAVNDDMSGGASATTESSANVEATPANPTGGLGASLGASVGVGGSTSSTGQ